MNETTFNHIMERPGWVKRVDGDKALVLIEYNDDGERSLFAIDKVHWERENRDIEVNQKILVSWNEENLDEPISIKFLESREPDKTLIELG